jgi:uncharacterized protein (TIGR02145 family)/uncharacterized repeat protein (TIGR02543 family)
MTEAGKTTPVTSATVFTKHTTIDAVWMVGSDVKTYTIKLNPNGGTIILDEDGTTTTAEIAEHTTGHGTLDWLPHDEHIFYIGHIFDGWYTKKDGGDKVVEGVTKFVDVATIWARWTETKWTVIFDANGVGTAPPGLHVGHGGTAENPGPAAHTDGYIGDGGAASWKFDGWYKEAACVHEWDFKTDKVTAETRIYAKWTWLGVDITFLLDGGTLPSGTPNPMRTVQGGFLPGLPVPTKNGYTFLGWFASGGNSDEYHSVLDSRFGAGSIFSSSRTVYARWRWPSDAPVYTITFDANGGEFRAGAATSGTTGEGFRLTDHPPTPVWTGNDGLSFGGWFLNASGGGDRVTKSGTEFEENTTIYAHWTDKLAEDEFVDGRDGKIYRWVEIGTQKWMAQNLNYDDSKSLGRCNGDNDANCDTYGRLYTWVEAMDGKASSVNVPSGVPGSCPVGWHLPSKVEWDMLIRVVGNASGLRVQGFGPNSNDTYGFAALPGGWVNSSGSNTAPNDRGRWWSATEATASTASYLNLLSNSASGMETIAKDHWYSVRCVED